MVRGDPVEGPGIAVNGVTPGEQDIPPRLRRRLHVRTVKFNHLAMSGANEIQPLSPIIPEYRPLVANLHLFAV